MPNPVRPTPSEPAKDVQFKHFGVLNDGTQSKSSMFTSVGLNIVVAIVIIILGATAKHKIDAPKEVVLVDPTVKPVPPPKPIKMPPPPKIKTPPPPLVQPKTVVVNEPVPEPKPIPKPPEIKQPDPKPVVQQAPPKAVVAAAAPKPVAVNLGQSAAVVNNNPHPTAVSLGQANNPIAVSNRPAVSNVNLGNSGLAGMPPGSGQGPHATSVNLGSGQPNGSLSGGGAKAVVGVKLGVTGGTGPLNSTARTVGPTAVNLAQNTAPPPPNNTAIQRKATSPPTVSYKPHPEYTPEARNLGLQGDVAIRIRVSATGQVTVLGVTSGLGHGLDESAQRAVMGTRFKPALDASGQPIEWEGVVKVAFQLAG